ncbi:hypothetical protein BD311DRAFT_662425 [Dichomitus squalens]|uniref:Uncharacterized protein n=1 Tax=Dichomitus squalens TaxID=114155 RepID=A0A4Q9MP14_9APHY|nr:hypothetical protein BD311DRAFT_662425 [Dichomitus squalens]
MNPRTPSFPMPGTYAIIQINLHELPKLHNAFASLNLEDVPRGKKYLVCMGDPIELPLVDSQWCRYSVSFIGNTLRPEEPEAGIESNMVVPIFPCAVDGRPQVTPSPPLPFRDCYHWYGFEMGVCALGRRDRYPLNTAPQLSVADKMKIDKTFASDRRCIFSHQQNIQATSAQPISSTPPPSEEPRSDGGIEADHESASAGSDRSSYLDLPGLLGFDRNTDLRLASQVPLVKLWPDPENHLSAETIPDPRGFQKEAQNAQL